MSNAAIRQILSEPESLSGEDLAITLRSATRTDDDLFRRLFVASRSAAFELAGADPRGLQQFLAVQFELQENAIVNRYPDADYRVVQVTDDDCGRSVVDRQNTHMHLVDIILEPAVCGRGIGSRILRDLCGEAQDTGRSFTLNVEQTNPAVRLYRRFGFAEMESDGVYLKMRYAPTGVAE